MNKSRIANTRGTPYAVVISCAGDGDTGGGLCIFDGNRIETVDRVSTAGLCLADDRFFRLLRTPLCTGSGEMLVYDQRGVKQYLRIDELSDSHTLTWDGRHLVVASTGTNSLLWISLDGEVVRRWRAPGEDDSWHLNDLTMHDSASIQGIGATRATSAMGTALFSTLSRGKRWFGVCAGRIIRVISTDTGAFAIR